MALIPNGGKLQQYKECGQMQMGVSYNNTKSAGKCEHLQRDGGSINRLQVYIGDTNVNWG